jgi:nitrile hydratase accessory protein
MMARTETQMSASPALPRDGDGPVFREPWEAKAFAMAVRLAEAGVFSWSEWTEALSAEIAAAREAGDEDLGDTYYRYWLRALEALVARKSGVAAGDIEDCAEQWRRAYLNTPHGQPIELDAAQKSA